MIEKNCKLNKHIDQISEPLNPNYSVAPKNYDQSNGSGQPVGSRDVEKRKYIGTKIQKVVDLQGQRFVRSLDLLLLRKYPRRIVTSGRYSGLVCSAVGRDETGIVGIVLWGEHVNLVKSGDVVRINNGWCRVQNGELVVSTGRYGSLTIVES